MAGRAMNEMFPHELRGVLFFGLGGIHRCRRFCGLVSDRQSFVFSLRPLSVCYLLIVEFRRKLLSKFFQ